MLDSSNSLEETIIELLGLAAKFNRELTANLANILKEHLPALKITEFIFCKKCGFENCNFKCSQKVEEKIENPFK